MKHSWRLAVTLFTIGLVSLAPAAFAETTVMNVRVGDALTANIGQAGVDTVQAHFSAAQGPLEITARAAQGSDLRVTVLVKDDSGAVVPGTDRSIGWVPGRAVVHYVTLPASGNYYAEFGASSGSGGLWARIAGTASSTQQPPPPTSTTLSGRVSDDLTGDPIAGANVFVDNVLFAVTDANGDYSGDIDPGSYAVRYEASGFDSLTQNVDIMAGTPVVLNIDLLPENPVTVDASVTGSPLPGALLDGVVDVTLPGGYNVNSITWTQKSGVPVGLGTRGAGGTPITLGTETAYKDELIHFLSEPPVGQEDLPPNVQLPEEFHGGLPSRFMVVGINHFALEEAGLIVMEVEVDTDLGIFHEEVEIHTQLPWKVSTGLADVPFGDPVLFHGPEQSTYDWNLVDYPSGSMAALNDATTRNPWFTPDIEGLYEIEVSPENTAAPMKMYIYAGGWEGVIVDQDMDGRPVPDSACTSCHNDIYAADKFTEWSQTGHAEILTDNLNTSTHYGPNCFGCHAVGFDAAAGTGGFSEAGDYQDFLNAGLLNSPGDNWTTMLQQFPEAARLANIQCENCHGPQDSLGHGFGNPPGDPRVSLSSDVCASCHAEPLRHARFQQWQLSGHANYELAISEGTNGSCARCHSANGFLTWLPVLLGDEPGDPTANIPITWTADDVHPQTCPTCHDPHANGSTTGIGTNATVRISGNTPPLIAGFTAYGVGRGAICMTCHNSRNGLHNDDVWDDYYGTSEASRAPHHSAQADMIMGENAYLVQTGVRGNHSFVNDACVACHMVQTPPPDDLSYNQSGTNHTFYAGIDVCAQCHGPAVDGVYVQGQVQDTLDILQGMIEDAHLAYIGQQTGMGNIVDFSGTLIADVADIQTLEFGEYHGRQALTLTLTDQSVVGPVSANSIDILDGGMNFIEGYYDSAPPGMLKAGWNYALVSNDGSMGVHNPSYAYAVMVSGIDALDPAAAAALPLPGWVDSGMINAMMP